MFNFWKNQGKGKCRRRRKGRCGGAGRGRNKPLWGGKKGYVQISSPVSEVTDEILQKSEEIYKLLPKKDCGACGFDSCYETAVEVAKGLTPPDACNQGIENR